MKGKLFCRQQRQKRLEFSEEGRLVGPKCLYKYIIEKTAGSGYRHLIKKATKLVLGENIPLQTFSLSYPPPLPSPLTTLCRQTVY